MAQRTLRRLPSVGWEEARSTAGSRRIVRDDGEVLVGTRDALVGTAEAAAIVGVRPPNFVRDWAARPDFPSPAGALSSGRVWRAADVAAYRDRRRRPAPEGARLSAIARRVAWWDAPERTLARPDIFIARVLAEGSVEEILDVRAAFGSAALRRAVAHASADLLDARARRYWELVLDMPHTEPRPARRIP